jgi:hypothetical protein
MRFVVLLFGLAAATLGGAETPGIQAKSIPVAGAGASASGPSVTLSADGVAWLTWLETEGDATTLRAATFDAEANAWRPAGPIARGRNWTVKSSDFPQFTAGTGGRAAALWYVNNPETLAAPAHGGAAHAHGPTYRAWTSVTADGGRTWSEPALLTRETPAVEFAALTTLADGRVLALWLDSRAKGHGGGAQQLYSRVLGDSGPDLLVDASVCDCCHTTLTAFPDGSALAAYRGRTRDEVRDIQAARFRGGAWETPYPLKRDEWRIAGCPVNGPQLASDGGRVAAAWFTGADNDPRVLVTFSPDAGGRFLLPLRLTDGKTAGRVSTRLLHDGALLVTYVDLDGALWLRRVSPDFVATEPVRLTAPEQGRVKGVPRMALWRDYLGGREPAQVLVAWTSDAGPALRTLLVKVPEADLIAAEKNCDCSPGVEDLLGFPIRGTVVAAQPERGILRVRHYEVPGIYPEGERDFRVDPAALAPGTAPGRQFLGRVELRDGAGWLRSVRLIGGGSQ